MGAITPALTARIPPEPRGQGCLAESSTGMGDPEENALVGPLIIIPRPPERLFARAAEAGSRVKNDVKGRRSGCDHTSTNAPDPIRTPKSSCCTPQYPFSSPWRGFSRRPQPTSRFDPLFRPQKPSFCPQFHLRYLRGENVHLHLNPRGGSETKREGWEMGAITPALTARIPPEPRGQGCLAESSTGMGDPEESALVGPLIIIPCPPERHFARAAEAGRRVKNDVKGRRSGCDHTSTNAPDPIRTPQLSVFGRESSCCTPQFSFSSPWRGLSRRPQPTRRFDPLFRPEMPSFSPNFTCLFPSDGFAKFKLLTSFFSPFPSFVLRSTSEAENVHLHLNAGGGSGTKREGWEMGAITPVLTARIPPEPRSQGCLAESSTGMGDPDESALVGPLIIILRPPELLFARAAEAGRRVKNDVKGRRSGCDHTSTNAPDPIRTPKSSCCTPQYPFSSPWRGFSRRPQPTSRFDPLFRPQKPSFAPNFTCVFPSDGFAKFKLLTSFFSPFPSFVLRNTSEAENVHLHLNAGGG
ncbi:hypothetical protein Ancab_002203 [Ancistrocladus abbreviatus]